MSDARNEMLETGLSPALAAHKAEMLERLHGRLDARMRRRRTARAAGMVGAAAIVLTGAGLLAALLSGPTTPPSDRLAIDRPPSPAPNPDAPNQAPTPPESGIAYIAPASGDRVTVRVVSSPSVEMRACDEQARAGDICLLNDEQLLAALAEAGRPSGLVRIGGEAFVVPQRPGQEWPGSH